MGRNKRTKSLAELPKPHSESQEEQFPSTAPPLLSPSKKPTTTKRPLTTLQSPYDQEDNEPPVSKLKSTSNPKSNLTIAEPGPNEDSSKKLFQRVFSEQDEIQILKGLIDFKNRKSSHPNDDDRYGSIMKRVDVEVNKAQMIDKVRRLKKKFTNLANNTNKNFINLHEKLLFDLSKNIWDLEDINHNVVAVAQPLSMKSGKSYKDIERGDGMDVDFKVGEVEVKQVMRAQALKLMGEKGRNEIREMWEKVEIAQLEVDSMRYQARIQENRMIMEALGLV